jgi:hypothetical protein
MDIYIYIYMVEEKSPAHSVGRWGRDGGRMDGRQRVGHEGLGVWE